MPALTALFRTAVRKTLHVRRRVKIARELRTRLERGWYRWNQPRTSFHRLGTKPLGTKNPEYGVGRLKSLVRNLYSLPVFFVRKPGVEFRADAGFVREDGQFVLLDRIRGQVCRPFPPDGDRNGYIHLRKELQENVPGPAFRVCPHRDIIIEDWVKGERLYELPIDTRKDHVQSLLALWPSHIRASRGGDAESFFIALGVWSGPWRQSTAASWVKSRAETWPLVPTHADLHAANLLVHGGRVTLIDFEPGRLCYAPFWYDPLNLILTSAYWPPEQPCPDIAAAYVMGAFDHLLDEIFLAAGIEPLNWDEDRTHLAAAWAFTETWLKAVTWEGTRPPEGSELGQATLRRIEEAVGQSMWSSLRV